jgi:hypothetical protein
MGAVRAPKQPQLPHLGAVPQHLAAVADALERADADVEAVCQQAESCEEPEYEGARQPHGGGDGPQHERHHDTDDRPRPNDEQRIRIFGQIGPRDGERMQDDACDAAAGQRCTNNVA